METLELVVAGGTPGGGAGTNRGSMHVKIEGQKYEPRPTIGTWREIIKRGKNRRRPTGSYSVYDLEVSDEELEALKKQGPR